MPSFVAKLIGSPVGPVYPRELRGTLPADILAAIRAAGIQINDQGIVDDVQAPPSMPLPPAINARVRTELELTDADLQDEDDNGNVVIRPIMVQFDPPGGGRKTRKGKSRKGKSRKGKSRKDKSRRH